MAVNSRFFIIRPDGTTSTVTNEQLNTMRLGGFVGPDDKIIPIPGQLTPPDLPENIKKPELEKFSSEAFIDPAAADLDTAPLLQKIFNPNKSPNFNNIDDLEIDHAFASATSQSLYHLQANEADTNLQLGIDDSLDSNKELLDGRTLYNIRFSDGRVIGPFDAANVWERISQNMLSGNEQFALAGSEEFKPILNHVGFRAAFKIFKESLSPRTETETIGTASIAAILLKLSHQLVTGWLLVKNKSQTKLLSIAVGKILNIHTNQNFENQHIDELNELFAWETGVTWFETDALAASDSRVISQDVLSLCRHMTEVKNGFALSRIIKTLGDQKQTLQLKSSSQWAITQEQLSQLEEKVTAFASRGLTVHATLHELLVLGISEEEILHAVFILYIADCVSFIEEKITEEIKKLTSQLFSKQYIELLQLNTNSSQEEVQKQLGNLKDKLSEMEQSLPSQDPLKQKIQERFSHIAQILSNPTERYVLLKAREINQDLEQNPELGFTLKKEYLQKTVHDAIEQKLYLEVLPEAELYYELLPTDSDATSCILLTRFFAATTPNDQESTLLLLKEALKNFPNDKSVLFAAASIYIKAHYFKKARITLKSLQKKFPDDKRIIDLKEELQEELAAPYSDTVASRAPWINIIFTTLITLAMTGILWLLAVDIEMGKTETLSHKVDNFIWIRAGTLLIFTAIGFAVLHRRGAIIFFKRLSYGISWPWIAISLTLGILFAVFFDAHSQAHVRLSVFAAFSLFTSIFFERLYFSGFLGQDLFQSVKKPVLAILALATLHSLYYLSFYELMVLPIEAIPLRFLIINLGLSLPLAVIQFLSKSVTGPLLLQLAFTITEFLISQK